MPESGNIEHLSLYRCVLGLPEFPLSANLAVRLEEQ